MDFIVDLDGTLSDPTHRLHLITGETKDWDAFYAAAGSDKPLETTIAVVHALMDAGHVPVFCTGRSDSCRAVTEKWLDERVFEIIHDPTSPEYSAYSDLYMRKHGDHRPDTVVKLEMLVEIREKGRDPVLAIEDRKAVVDMWRDAGLTCFQVAPGDF